MEMRNKIARLLEILLVLRSREWVSGRDLADRFGVSLRTIYRDIEMMQRNGVPVVGEPGPDGGYRLEAETPIDALQFADDDAFMLYLYGFAEHNLPEALHARVKDALAQFEGIVQPEHMKLLDYLRRRVYFDTTEWYWQDRGTGLLPRLREALLRGNMIDVAYRNRGSAEVQNDLIAPYGLVWKSGEWYLVGRLLSADSIERLRVSRISSVNITERTFTWPEDFSLKEWWTHNLEKFGKGNTKVVLRVDSDAREEILSLRTKSSSAIVDEEDATYLTLYVDKWNWLVPLVLSYGSSVTVMEPSELRSAVINALAQNIARYSNHDAQQDRTFINDDSRRRATRGRNMSSE